MFWSNYKKSQGMIVRTTSGIILFLIALYGCYALYKFIPPLDTSIRPYRATFWGTELIKLPLFDFIINYGMVLSAIFFILISLLIYRWLLNKPKTVDFLIETEDELKKVSWPPKHQYFGSTVAVIISVVVIGVFLLVVDLVFMRLIRDLLKLY